MQGFLEPLTHAMNSERFDNMQDLIDNFKTIIKEGEGTPFKERQFLIFNGKIRSEEDQ